MLQYSNGWGHLIMSLVGMGCGMYLIMHGGDANGIGIGLVTTVSAAWFIPNAAKQVAYQVAQTQHENAQQQAAVAQKVAEVVNATNNAAN